MEANNLDDKVRIRKARIAFKKGYLPFRTEEIFTITVCVPSDPVLMKLQN